MENNQHKAHLLIVEDDLENQKLLMLYLRKHFEVEICDSADMFYKMLKEKKYDIFLMDISLRGEKNGLELTKELRASEEYKDAPIVCMSAHVFPRDQKNAYDAGVDIFLPRPVYNQELLKALNKILNEKRNKKSE